MISWLRNKYLQKIQPCRIVFYFKGSTQRSQIDNVTWIKRLASLAKTIHIFMPPPIRRIADGH